MAAIKPWLLSLSVPLLLLQAAPGHAADKIPNVTLTRHLGFGNFVAAAGGTITINPVTGGRSKTGGVVLISGGTISSASFSLTESGSGKALKWGTITLPANNTVMLTSGSNSMALNDFVSDPAGTFNGITRRTLLVGATLTVAPNQPPGNYAGTFNVTVNYQ